ncbi:MAG: hypothetical protein J2P52_12540 [Blastocatellia bacterium]|nr:hypothetical protein [Blastocatellia bacterium]
MTAPKRLAAAVLLLSLSFSTQALRPISADAQKKLKPEDIIERSILLYTYGAGRTALYGIQRNGTLRALIKFYGPEGTREGKSVTKFIRKGKLAEDLLMIDLELPGTRYTIGFDGQETWAIQDGEIQKPPQEAIDAFRSAHEHSYEALLRYKENGSTLEYAGMNKLGTLEMDLIDMISPSGARTRYEISRRTGRIIYANYEDSKSTPVKYRLYFKDFKPVQNTLVPHEVQVFQDGKLIEERKLVESIFNIQLEEKAFKAENANKPAEAAIRP